MAGDPSNARIWPDADVYIGSVDAEDPTNETTPFGPDWHLVGLLDGEAGFTYPREEEETDIFAWGGILVRTSRRNFKQEVTFTLLEDNAVTRQLIWPGSTGGKIVVPRPARVKLALETREGDTVRRLITAYQAEVKVDGDFTDNEADLTRYPMRARIFPLTTETPAVLFKEQPTDLVSS